MRVSHHEEGTHVDRTIKTGKLLLVAAIILLVMFLIGSGAIYWGSARSLQQATNRMISRGHPMSMAELDAYHVGPPPDQDSTPLWLESLEQIESIQFEKRYGALHQPATDGTSLVSAQKTDAWAEQSEAEALVTDLEPIVQKMLEAEMKGGRARFPRDYRRRANMSLDDMVRLRSLARALDLCAIRAAKNGDAMRTGEAMRALSAIPESLRNEPILLSHLVRLAIEGIFHHRLASVMPRVAIPASDLKRIQDRLSNRDPAKAAQLCIDGERAFQLDGLRGNLNPNRSIAHWPIPGESELLLRYYEQLDELKSLPLAQWRSYIDQNDAEFQSYIESWPWRRLQSTRVRMLFPPVNVLADAIVAGEANARLSIAMIGGELYRRENHVWPAQLESLVPRFLAAIPEDPYDGLPLRIVQDERGWRLYSIGNDGVDRKGLVDEEFLPNAEPNLQLPPATRMPK